MTRTIVDRWNAYWFAPGSLVDLAVCRIVIVGFQLYHLVRKGHMTWFEELSQRPDSLYDPIPILHLLLAPAGWHARPSLEVLQVIYWLVLLCGLLALIGLRTGLALVAFAVGNVFITAYGYSFGDFHHPEGLMMIALATLAVSPCGRALSLDEIGRRLRSARRTGRFEPSAGLAAVDAMARWPLVLVRWMYALIYLSAAWSKLERGGLDWMNGYTLQYYMLEDGLRWGGIGLWLGEHHLLSQLMAIGTMLFEGTFLLVLLFPRLARIYVPVGIGMHTGIYLIQRAPFFQFVFIYSVFVPWSRGLQRLSDALTARRGGRPVVLYDDHCPLCVRSMTVLDALDWLDRLDFRELEADGPALVAADPALSMETLRRRMHVRMPDGTMRAGFDAWRAAARFAPLLWPMVPLAAIPPLSTLGERLYDRIAARRRRRCPDGACAHHGGGQG